MINGKLVYTSYNFNNYTLLTTVDYTSMKILQNEDFFLKVVRLQLIKDAQLLARFLVTPVSPISVWHP